MKPWGEFIVYGGGDLWDEERDSECLSTNRIQADRGRKTDGQTTALCVAEWQDQSSNAGAAAAQATLTRAQVRGLGHGADGTGSTEERSPFPKSR